MKEIIFGLGVLLFGAITPESIFELLPSTSDSPQSASIPTMEIEETAVILSDHQIINSGLSLPQIVNTLYPSINDMTLRRYQVEVPTDVTGTPLRTETVSIERKYNHPSLSEHKHPLTSVSYSLNSMQTGYWQPDLFAVAVYDADMELIFVHSLYPTRINSHLQSRVDKIKNAQDKEAQARMAVQLIADMAPKVISGQGNFVNEKYTPGDTYGFEYIFDVKE